MLWSLKMKQKEGDEYPQEKFDSTKDRSFSLGVLKDNFKEIPEKQDIMHNNARNWFHKEL